MDIGRDWPVQDGWNLLWICLDTLAGDYIPQKLDAADVGRFPSLSYSLSQPF
jgi:hypothetical protein